MQPVIQCVPNFSEGRDLSKVQSIVSAAREASSARVIDYSSDPDHNRMVVTLLGTPQEIRHAVFAAASRAVELLDLRTHQGAHPRIGVVDVVPLVPVRDISMHECVVLSRAIGKDIALRLGVPVYFYEYSAIKSHRVNLPDVRRGGFEHLVEEGELTGDHTPDVGPHRVHPSAGATVVGARGPLIAYNVNLNTEDMEIARAIVRKIRSGEAGLAGVKSMAVWLATRSQAQVSMNITRPDECSLKQVYDFIRDEASSFGVEVAESEIIGALLQRYLDCVSPAYLRAHNFKPTQIIDTWL